MCCGWWMWRWRGGWSNGSRRGRINGAMNHWRWRIRIGGGCRIRNVMWIGMWKGIDRGCWRARAITRWSLTHWCHSIYNKHIIIYLDSLCIIIIGTKNFFQILKNGEKAIAVFRLVQHQQTGRYQCGKGFGSKERWF